MCETAASGMNGTGVSVRITCWDKGSKQARQLENVEEAAAASLIWVHVLAQDKEAATRYLSENFPFHELEIEDALSPGERPHLHESESHLFFTVPAIRVEEVKLYFVEVGFFVSKGRLVTVATEPVGLLDHWFGICEKHGSGHIADASRLVHHLLDAIIDAYYPAMDELEDQAEALEDMVFKGQPVGVKDLLRLKRRLLETRRRLSPFRDILNGLLRHDIPFIAKADRIYYQDVYDHVLRVLEHVDLNRDLLASVLDANLATVSNRLNEVMRMMTVIATVLMSAAFFTGLYGMNFKHMPELDWAFGYPAVIVAMVVTTLIELWIFRRNKWI